MWQNVLPSSPHPPHLSQANRYNPSGAGQRPSDLQPPPLQGGGVKDQPMRNVSRGKQLPFTASGETASIAAVRNKLTVAGFTSES